MTLDPTPALELLEHPRAALHELQEWMYRASQLEPTAWADLLHGHEPAEVRARAEVLYRAAREAELQEVTLGTVIGASAGASWRNGSGRTSTTRQERTSRRRRAS